MSDYCEPINWTSTGEMWVTGVAKDYLYMGITRDIYDHAVYLAAHKRYKELWNYLRPYAKEAK